MGLILELKDGQKERRKLTRVKTTSTRVAGRQADLSAAYLAAKNVDDIRPAYEQRQCDRVEATRVMKKEATRKRREVEKADRISKKRRGSSPNSPPSKSRV